jgi:hypothetical protein
MARVPWVEQAWGQDELTRTHRLVGFTSFTLMLAHIVLITLGYAAGPRRPVGHPRRPRRQLPGDAARRRRHARPRHGRRHVGEEGPGAAALRVLAPDPPLRLPRRGAGPAAPAVDRRDFLSSPSPRPSGGACMPCAPAPSSLFRVLLPLWRSLRAPIRVLDVRQDAPDVTTVTVGGAWREAAHGARRPVLPLALPRRPRAGRGPTPTPCRRPPTGHPALHRCPRR